MKNETVESASYTAVPEVQSEVRLETETTTSAKPGLSKDCFKVKDQPTTT